MNRLETLKKMIDKATGDDLTRAVSILHNELRNNTIDKSFDYYTEDEYFANRADSRRFKKYKTGYKKLDEVAMPRAGHITTIPAYTKHGKSIFSMNLCYNMFFEHPDTNILFYNFESSSFDIMSFLSRIYYHEQIERKDVSKELSHFQWDEQRRIKDTEAWHYDNIAIGMFSKRIFPRDLRIDAATLDTHIRRVIDDKGNIGIIFIDYIQDMRPDKRTGEHHADIENMVIDVDRIANDYGVSIIIPAQYGRWTGKGMPQNKWDVIGEHRIFGSAIISKKSDVMYSLFNETIFNMMSNKIKNMPRLQDMEIDVLVSRAQNYASDLTFTFDRNSYRIYESQRVVEEGAE